MLAHAGSIFCVATSGSLPCPLVYNKVHAGDGELAGIDRSDVLYEEHRPVTDVHKAKHNHIAGNLSGRRVRCPVFLYSDLRTVMPSVHLLSTCHLQSQPQIKAYSQLWEPLPRKVILVRDAGSSGFRFKEHVKRCFCIWTCHPYAVMLDQQPGTSETYKRMLT